MKISYKSIVLALLFVFVSSSLMASQFVVVIDAGHGGKDAGAVGRTKLMEKDLNLDVSRRVAS